MTALSDDGWLSTIRPQPARITGEDYERLPEEIARAIEVVDGYVVYCEAPSPDHQTATRRLANLLEKEARPAMSRGHGCLTVGNVVDLRLWDVPLFFRRPDVLVYRCLNRKRGERLRAEYVLLVLEIVSPGSETQDVTDKFGEYAKSGIPHYWIVRLDGLGVSVVERYQLDHATMHYKHIGTHMRDEVGDTPTVTNPIPITIEWPELEF